MNELISRLVSQADLTEAQAKKVVGAISGERVDGAADMLRGATGSFFD